MYGTRQNNQPMFAANVLMCFLCSMFNKVSHNLCGSVTNAGTSVFGSALPGRYPGIIFSAINTVNFLGQLTRLGTVKRGEFSFCQGTQISVVLDFIWLSLTKVATVCIRHEHMTSTAKADSQNWWAHDQNRGREEEWTKDLLVLEAKHCPFLVTKSGPNPGQRVRRIKVNKSGKRDQYQRAFCPVELPCCVVIAHPLT